MTDGQNNGNNKPEKNKNGFFMRTGEKITQIKDNLLKRQADYYEKNDPIYLEPIHKSEEEQKPRVLVSGGIDLWFLLIVVTLLLYGAVMSYSASSVFAQQRYGDSMHFFKQQILFILLATVGTVPFVWKMKPWMWKVFAVIVYAVAVVLLLMVPVIGTTVKGAKRWIVIGPINIQPSEVAKMAVVLMLSLVMSKYDKRLNITQKFGGKFTYGVLVPGCVIGLVCVLVALEKHLSGTIIIGLIGLTMMLIGGTDLKWMGAFAAVGATGAGFILLLSDYAQKRVDTWIHIEDVDPLGAAWQTLQGLYAIGSGGFFGLGLGNSRQKFGYVSEPQNDFIFTIICEELGFIGAFALMALVVMLVWRGYKIASKAPDKFSSLVVYGLVTKVALQTLLNIAVVTNSVPNTGISLPFFSSGGTALAMQIFEMGIVLNISRFSYQEK